MKQTLENKGLRFGVKALLAIVVAGLALSGCGRYSFQRREAWRDQLEQRCMSSGAVQMTQYVRQANPINGPGVCGMNYPLKVDAIDKGRVMLARQQTLACQMIPTTDRWIELSVQPLARKWYGSRVVEVKAGSYSCRNMNHNPGAKLSEHSFGNALDVFGFVLENGHEVTISRGWKGEPADQGFLREVFIASCDHFTTVLGPGVPLHYDHLHLDLARHDAQWVKRVCRPRPETVQVEQPAAYGYNPLQGSSGGFFGKRIW